MSEFLSTAIEAANAAAEIVTRMYRGNLEVSIKADKSPVTDADVACEKAIRAVLERRFPAHGFYGEETGKSRADAEYLWIVDPIDGTKAFVREYPMFSTQIALMRGGQIDLVVVGADRIAANGDVANKIGTYTVAVLAKEHGIPFYVAAPISTIDLATPDGSGIPIEERNGKEVTHMGGARVTPVDTKVRNPAFDVTPNRYVTGIITERGIARAPFSESLSGLVNGVA